MSVNPHDAEDTAVYEKQGFGNRIGFGKKPALLIIDFINGELKIIREGSISKEEIENIL